MCTVWVFPTFSPSWWCAPCATSHISWGQKKAIFFLQHISLPWFWLFVVYGAADNDRTIFLSSRLPGYQQLYRHFTVYGDVCVHLILPRTASRNTLSLQWPTIGWGVLFLVDFSKAYIQQMEVHSLFFLITWITKFSKVIMDFSPNDTKNKLHKPAFKDQQIRLR